jgi:ABC transporter substrate binding protein
MTRTIPIVFVLTADPVGQGFVQSLARPGGNITGFGVYVAPMMAKMAWLVQRDCAGAAARCSHLQSEKCVFREII